MVCGECNREHPDGKPCAEQVEYLVCVIEYLLEQLRIDADVRDQHKNVDFDRVCKVAPLILDRATISEKRASRTTTAAELSRKYEVVLQNIERALDVSNRSEIIDRQNEILRAINKLKGT